MSNTCDLTEPQPKDQQIADHWRRGHLERCKYHKIKGIEEWFSVQKQGGRASAVKPPTL